MMSEHKFSSGYTSFWHQLLPTLDGFVRRKNLERMRFANHLPSSITPDRRGLVNELSFRVFRHQRQAQFPISAVSASVLDALSTESSQYISQFKDRVPHDTQPLSSEEITEALEISKRLDNFFGAVEKQTPILFSPLFSGCGVLVDCEGDIICGTTLYEIKAGERTFRTLDVRQLIIYCALNEASGKFKIENIGLVNPRLGTYFVEPVNSLAQIVSGTDSFELYGDLIDYVSALSGSR